MSLTGNTRTKVAADHALITPDTFVRAPLPGWNNTTCVVHISPEIGSRFKMYTAEMQTGGSGQMSLLDVQRVMYVLEGKVHLQVSDQSHSLASGGYAYVPANTPHTLSALENSRVLVIDKPYMSLVGANVPDVVVGHEPSLPFTLLAGDEALQVRTMLPDNFSFDMAFNSMSFDLGAHLPFVETHVMEHGLMFVQGGGVYRLSDSWYTVQPGDVIWMASFCPQWFGALGKTSAKYLIYKDVNRHSLEGLI